jgi:hypothetical protein
MREEALLAVAAKLIEKKISEPIIGPRGFRGINGLDGKSFEWNEHEDKIRDLIRQNSLKFSDLSIEEIESLRGPAGQNGKDGKDGRDGKDFSLSEHLKEIDSIVTNYVSTLDLKLKFDDLTEEQKLSLKGERGPRGQRGRDGRSFDLSEHQDLINEIKDSAKIKFSDLKDEEREALKLRFSDLRDEERESLRLKFSDLTIDELNEIRGPRGQRGKRGDNGERGEKGDRGDIGPMGPRGVRGPIGMTGQRGMVGPQGIAGKDGRDGLDAPVIESVEVDQDRESFTIKISLSNGQVLETNKIKIPTNTIIISGGGRGGSVLADYKTHEVDEASGITYVGRIKPLSGEWMIERISHSGNDSSTVFANASNNPANSLWTQAWANRATLNYTTINNLKDL